ncbi:MAG: DMT family transporter [Anaerolineales bacterium]
MILEALPYLLIQGILFGTTLVASRYSVGQFSPTTYIWLRLALASLAYLSFYLVARKRHPWPRDMNVWKHATVMGIVGTAVPMTFIVMSLQFQSSGLTSILITANPALTVLLAHYFLPDERLNTFKSVGIALAFSGALLLALRGETGLAEGVPAQPLGYLLVLLAMLAVSSSTVYARRTLVEANSFDVASIQMFTAALTVMPLSVLFVGFDLTSVNYQGYFALGYAALTGTFLGTWLAFIIIQRFGATAASLVAYIIPIAAGLTGWLLLDEQITVTMLFGVLLVLGGVALLNRGSTANVPPG